MDGPVRVEREERGVATVTIDRPEVRNAFDAETIGRILQAFEQLGGDDELRIVVLTGAGDIFSAGADLNWMSSMVDKTFEENVEDSHDFEAMLRAVRDCSHPVVARVNGHAFGGGTGLVGCADISISVRDALFGFTEVRLGLVPAVISPYVLPKIGVGNARHLFLTGERFDAEYARRIGLVNEVCERGDLDERVSEVVDDLLSGGPGAQTRVKRMLHELASADGPSEAATITVETIAELRVSDEGQEGMRAFFDGREPRWRAVD